MLLVVEGNIQHVYPLFINVDYIYTDEWALQFFFFFKRIWIYLAHYALYYGDLDACLNQAGTGTSI